MFADNSHIQTHHFHGCPLSYKLSGNGADSVVFIQGVGLHGDGWLPQTEVLSDQFHCLTFDNRGIGLSQPQGVAITVEQMAADTLAIMDAAGMERAHIVGHSLGGIVAQQIGLTSPRRVRTLSLLCTSARGGDAFRLSWPLLSLGARSRIGSRNARRRAFLRIVMPKKYLQVRDTDALSTQLATLFGHDLADSPDAASRQLRALRGFNATGSLSALTGIPTLVLSAEHDIIFPPACGQNLANQIPGSQFKEISGAGHGVTIQCAAEVNTALRDHFQNSRV